MKKDPTEKELRARGYMTSEEFVHRLLPGLREYLRASSGEDVCHPEDLISNTLAYVEAAYLVISDCGAGPENKPPKV
jgi:hypothetical protein